MTPPPKQNAPAYKRSWKNLLINKRYQLRFTLFMVGLSTALMLILGQWVMRVANETTEVSMTSVRGTPCPKVPSLDDKPDPDAVPVPMKLDDPGKAAIDAPAAAPSAEPPVPAGSADAGSAGSAGSADPVSEPTRRVKVQIDESSMTMMPVAPVVPTIPADLGQTIVAHWTCELRLSGKLTELEGGRLRILWVMIVTGFLLVLFLAAYGIKMTHKVAGPLFKVGLYLNKMRTGRFDKVYNLRKGDQLVDFYEHFKTAHAGVVKMQKDDLERITAVIAAAEAAGAGEHATIVELREMVTRKEKALE